MYLFEKGSKTNEEYLTKSEKEMLAKNVKGYENYLKTNNLEKNPLNYANYLNDNSNHSKAKFTGDLAKKLELTYSNEVFADLMKGKNPLNQDQWKKLNPEVAYRKDGRLIKNSQNAKMGESMVLAVPRNLSMAYSISTPAKQRTIRECIDRADNIITNDMQRLVLPTSGGKDGKGQYVLDTQVAENPEKYKDIPKSRIIDSSKTKLIFAEFYHYENRDIEPHLHKHKQLLSMGEFTTMDGKTKMLSIDNQELYKHQKQLTSEFNTFLTQELAKEGIATESDKINGNEFAFRVSGISRESEKEVCNRQKELEKYSKLDNGEYVPSSIKHLEYIHKEEIRNATKKDKNGLNYDQVHNLIKDRSLSVLGEEGLKNYLETQKNLQGKKQVEEVIVSTKNITEFGLNGVMTKQNLKAEIGNQLRFSGQNFETLQDLRKTVDREYQKLIDNKEVVVMENGKIASRELVRNEMQALSRAKRLDGSIERKVELVKNEFGIEEKKYTYKNQADIDKLNKWLEGYDKSLPPQYKLFDGHKQAIKATNTNNPIIVVEGFAGSAKTQGYIRAINTQFNSKEYKEIYGDKPTVIGISTQSKTAKALTEAGIDNTMNSLKLCNKFYDFEKEQWKEKEFAKPENRNLKIILDEAGLMESKHFNVVLGIVEKIRTEHNGNAQLIAVGHMDQLNSVGAGNTWTDLNKVISADSKAELNKVIRHKNQETHTIAMSFLEGQPEKAIEVMKNKGWWHESKEGQTRDDLMNKLAEDFVKSKNPKNVAITFTNEDCSTLSDRIRSKLIQAQNDPNNHHYNDKNKIDYKNQIAIDVFKKGQSKKSKDSEIKYFAPNDTIIITEQMTAIKGFDEKTNKYIAEMDGKKPVVIPTSAMGRIVSIEQDKNTKGEHILTVDIDGQERKIFTAIAENRCIASNLAITTHSSQGITSDSFVLPQAGINKNMAYVMFSRMENEVNCYIEKEQVEGFVNSAKQQSVKESTVYDQNCREFYFNEIIENNKKQEQAIESLPVSMKHNLANGIEIQQPLTNQRLNELDQVKVEAITKAQNDIQAIRDKHPKEEVEIKIDINSLKNNNDLTQEQKEVVNKQVEESKTIEHSHIALTTMGLNELRRELVNKPEIYETNKEFFKNHEDKELLAEFYMEGAGKNYYTVEDMKKAFETVKGNGLLTDEFMETQIKEQNFTLSASDSFVKNYMSEGKIEELKQVEKDNYAEKFDTEQAKTIVSNLKPELIKDIVENQKYLEPNYMKEMNNELLNNKEIINSIKDTIEMGGLKYGSQAYGEMKEKLSLDNLKEIKQSYQEKDPKNSAVSDMNSQIKKVEEQQRQAKIDAEREALRQKELAEKQRQLAEQRAKEEEQRRLEAEERAKQQRHHKPPSRGMVLTMKPQGGGGRSL